MEHRQREIPGPTTNDPSSQTPELPPQTEQRTLRRVFDLADVIADIQASKADSTPEERTRELVNTPELVMIASGYLPDETEGLHEHPTRNTLLCLTGTFNLLVVHSGGEEEYHVLQPGMMAALNPGQPHRVRAGDQGMSILMVTIARGMPTSAPGYSVPVEHQVE